MKLAKVLKIGMLFLFLLIIFASKAYSADLYNVTKLNEANTIYDQTKELNTILDGLIGFGFVLIAFVITFVVVMSYSDVIAGFAAGSFAGTFTATIMLPLGFIAWRVYEVMLILLGISIFISYVARK